jgi:hypothetical protein
VQKLTTHFDDEHKDKLVTSIIEEFQTRFHEVQDNLQYGIMLRTCQQ